MQDRITPDEPKTQFFRSIAADQRLDEVAKGVIGACYLAAINGEDWPHPLSKVDYEYVERLEAWASESGWRDAAETHLRVVAAI